MNPSSSPTDPRERAVRRWWWAGVVAVLLGSFAWRGSDYDGPYFVADENITIKVVGRMRQTGDWDTNWVKADLPPDLHYDQYNFSSHLYAEYFFYRFVKLVPGTLRWRSTDDGVPLYRFFSVLLATCAVAQTIALGRRVGGRAVALGAGALAAVSTQLVQDAHFMRPEPFTTVLTLAAIGCCWPRERRQTTWLVAGAFILGMVVACKISLLLLAWLPLVPVVAGWRAGRTPWLGLAVIPFALAAGFAAGAPGAIAHPEKFLTGVQHLMAQYGGVHPPHSHPSGGPVADLLAKFFVATLGWPMLAGAAGGAIVLARRGGPAPLVLVAGPLALFGSYFSTKGVFFERNLSHVLPLLFVLAALGAAALAAGLAARARVAVWAVATGLIVLLALRPVRLTHALVTFAFSGREDADSRDFATALHDRHPETIPVETPLLMGRDVDAVVAQAAANRAPLLLRVDDYHDEWTARCLHELAGKTELQPVAVREGYFPGVPVSTLTTYHSWTDRYFIVRRRGK